MNTDKLLGLIFLGFMAGSVVISTSTDNNSPEAEDSVEVELVVGWDDKFVGALGDVGSATEKTAVDTFEAVTPLEEVVTEAIDEAPTETLVQTALNSDELRTLAALTYEYKWLEVSNMVVNLQIDLDVDPDGIYGHMTRNAHIKALKDRDLDATIVPSVPTSAITPRCQEWWDTALTVGWQESDLLQLGAIMYAESRCIPDAISQTSDYGLAQINWTAHGERLSAKGLTKQDLLDPVINLREARAIADFAGTHYGCQWQPWYMSGSWC